MANTGVSGKVVDENAAGIPNLLVEARDVATLGIFGQLKNTATKGPPLHGRVKTKTDGTFSIWPTTARRLTSRSTGRPTPSTRPASCRACRSSAKRSM
jgi:hypothetical protein